MVTPINHIPIKPMPIPSFQRNWQTLKSSVFGHTNLAEKFKSESDVDSQVISSQIQDDDITKHTSYQETEEIKTTTTYATGALPENCDNKLETTKVVNIDVDSTMEQQKTTKNAVIQKISVKSEKELQEPSKLILDIDQMRESSVNIQDPDLDQIQINTPPQREQ